MFSKHGVLFLQSYPLGLYVLKVPSVIAQSAEPFNLTEKMTRIKEWLGQR